MAIEYWGVDLTYLAAESLADYQYRFITLATDTTVQLMNGATEYPIGILQNNPASGETAEVRVIGISKLVMNDAVAVGAKLKSEYVSTSDNGKGDAADVQGDNVRAICLKASGAEDDIGTVLLTAFNLTTVTT